MLKLNFTAARERKIEYGFEWFLKAENIEVTEPIRYLEFLGLGIGVAYVFF
ncbi:MAG: hypothetical protein QXK88_07780 [Desulfurococcaceae archaeon]